MNPPAQPQNLMSRKQIFLLVILLALFLPAGIIYLAWITGRKTGLFISLGCFGTPLFLALLWFFCVTRPAEIGEKVPHVSWLQEDASEISYYRSYSWTAYEFKVSEESFRKHANSLWEFHEITEPETIERYNTYLLKPEDFSSYEDFLNATSVTVRNGICAKLRRSNGGGYRAIYDRDSGKAYIQTNPR